MRMPSTGRRRAAGIIAVVVGASLAACTPAHGRTTGPAATTVRQPHDTTGIVGGHCVPTAPPTPDEGPPSSARTALPLVPIVARELVLCRYRRTSEAPDGRLTAAKVITGGAAVAGWRARFNELPPGPAAPVACPPGVDDRVRIAFVASPDSYVVLSMSLSICGRVTDGTDSRSLVTEQGGRLIRDLDRLL
jgi:hypothetical protein